MKSFCIIYKQRKMWHFFGIVYFIICIKADHYRNLNITHSLTINSNDKEVSCMYNDNREYICDCGYSNENMILKKITGNIPQILIKNCKIISIERNCLNEINGLQYVRFENLEHLILQENSLAFPKVSGNRQLILEFLNTNITEIQSFTFTGNIEDIIFKFCIIQVIKPFAFTALSDSVRLIKFENTIIDQIEVQAFKKFNLEKMEIINSKLLSDLPSRAFYELKTMEHLKIQNTTFQTLHTKSFYFTYVSKLFLIDNNFETAYGECFHISVNDIIRIENNIFGIIYSSIFKEIIPSNEYFTYWKRNENLEFQLINNTIQEESELPTYLTFNPEFRMNIKSLRYSIVISCDVGKKLLSNNFFQTYANEIYFKLNDHRSTQLSEIVNESCVQTFYWLYIAMGTIFLLLILTIIIAIIIWYYLKRKKQQNKKIIVPESVTYRETQIILQIENAGLLITDMK